MIFVLGGEGFVGSAFVRLCARERWEHEVITRANYGSFVGRTCDIFVNANGNSKKNLALTAPLEEFDASVRSVRASVRDFSYGTYVLLSTCDVYPDCSSPTTSREDMRIDVRAQNPYGFHKYLAELIVQHAADRWLVARLGGFVGPGLWKNPIYDILVGGPLWLDIESELQFMSTDDAARIILALVRERTTQEVFNVCGRGTIRLSEVAAVADRQVSVRPGSPRVTYDVSTAKLEARTQVPETRTTVVDFVRAHPHLAQGAATR